MADDYSWIAPLIQGVGSAAGSIGQEGSQEEYLKLLKQLQAKYDGIQDARFDDVPPELLGDSALAGIKSDPNLAKQQSEVDSVLADIYNSGGLSLEDKAAQAQIGNKLARQTSANNSAITQDLANRGALNSGASLAARLQNAQSANQQAADLAQNTQASAQKRAIQALQQRYANSSDRDNEQYRRQADAARAADVIARANAQSKTDAARYRNSMQQQQFSNAVSKVNGQKGLTQDFGGYYSAQGDRRARQGDAIGGAGSDSLTKWSTSRDPKRARIQSAWDDEEGSS